MINVPKALQFILLGLCLLAGLPGAMADDNFDEDSGAGLSATAVSNSKYQCELKCSGGSNDCSKSCWQGCHQQR